MRPNIRVEIQNNLVEPMEVDENEEGEISDGEDKGIPETPQRELIHAVNKIPSTTFTSGIDIFDKKEQEKLQERARRFHLKPNEIKNFTDEDLKVLHSSLGISPSNEANVRFEVIHMRGIEQMNAGDILDYFLEYAPVSVEWIDEESCNVVWSDKVSAARALHFISKAVRGMPVRDDSSYFDSLQEGEEVDQSVLIMNRNREVQLQEEPETPQNKLLDEDNSVDISEITVTIPPGYWRLGKLPSGKCVLLRFALKTDKKALKLEHFGRYYKTQGKRNVKLTGKDTSEGIFGRNKDMHRRIHNDDNPWSTLAKNWDEDRQFREKERTYAVEEPKIEIKNQSLRVRLGTKRKEEETEEIEQPKKVKVPRMRMYADEEEEKIRRRKMLKRIDHQIKKIDADTSTNSDLRSVLNMTNRTHAVKIEQAEPEVFDLGTTLKNRNRKMVFEIKREADETEEQPIAKENDDRAPSKDVVADRKKKGRSRRYSSDDEDFGFRSDKPKSKVAVVIKTQKKPMVASAVASSVWSRVSKSNNTDSENESDSEESISERSSESEAEEFVSSRLASRPGFHTHSRERNLGQANYKSPLKIEINNDHFKRT